MQRGGIRRRSIPLACLALAWLAPGPAATAGDGAVAVYTGVEPSALASAEVASLLARLDPPVELGAPPAHLTGLLDEGQVRVVGSARAAYCDGELLDPSSLVERADELLHALDEVEFQTADFLLQELAVQRPCYASPPDGTILARESFLAGILAFYRGDGDAAARHFREALARHPDLPWDENYPPSAQQGFADALLSVLRADPATLTVQIPPGAELWLDGFEQSSTTAPLSLRPGRHLIHVGDPGTGYDAVEVELDPGAEAALVTGQVLTQPDALERQERLIFELVTAEVAARGLSAAYVVRLPDRIWRVDPYEGTLVPVEAPAGVVVDGGGAKPGGRVHPAGPVLTAIGAALAVGGAVLGAVERKQALDLHGQLESWDWAAGPAGPTLDEFERHRSASYAGWGLLAGGGAVLAVGVPLTLKLRRPVEVTATISTGVESGGWGLGLSVRPARGTR